MASGLESLRDDGIDSVRFEPASLVDRCRRRQDSRAEGSDSREQVRGGKAEMKAHYRGPELGQGFDSFAVEGQSLGSRRDGAWIDSEFCKVRRKRGAPDRFPLDAELGVGMAEEVHIERLRGVRTDRCELLTHVVQAEHRARKGA